MELRYKNFYLKLNWKTIVGVCVSIGGLSLFNTLSEREQLQSFELDLKNKRLGLNT